MKNWLILIMITSFTVAFAEARKSVLPQGFAVISDEYSSLLKPGECIVTGKIHNQNYYSDGQIPQITNALVSTLDKRKSTYSDDKGEYKLILEEGDTSIFMFAKGYEEVVVWNYKFKSQHIVYLDFYAYSDYNMIEVDKPVIYLYSESELNAEVKFDCRSNVTFTYPEYDNGWNVKVSSTGLEDSKSGKKYAYLFWEAETNNLNFKFESSTLNGFIINTDTVVSFLENSLKEIGLNATEQTDFITFWAPRMIENEFALVQFLTNESYDEMISSLSISPSPNAMLRVYLLYSPLNSENVNLKVVPQHFGTFTREGFCVVEWGGSELPSFQLIP